MQSEITIEGYSKRGHGRGRLNGETVDVFGAIKGDRVLIEPLRRKKGSKRGKLLELIESAKDRTEKKCCHSGSCGGCTFQVLKYSSQLEEKQKRIEELFSPYYLEAQVAPIIGCEDPWRYRNKMEYSFSQDRSKNRYLGLILSGSRGNVLNLEECHLTDKWFIEVLSSIRSWWKASSLQAYHPPSDTGSLRTLTLRSGVRTKQKMVILTVSGRSDYALTSKQLDGYKQAVIDAIGEEVSIYLTLHHAVKGKPTRFSEMHLHGEEMLEEELIVKKSRLKLMMSPSSFFQPNPLQAEKLYEKALEMFSQEGRDHLFDLYAGIGSIGLSMAHAFTKVTAIEINPYAIWDAKHNLEINNISNMQVYKGDVKEVLERLSYTPKEFPTHLILDPPRSGLDKETLKLLPLFGAKEIVYISCNPFTQADDVQILNEHYQVVAIQPVDQFPHTPHIENIVKLVKR